MINHSEKIGLILTETDHENEIIYFTIDRHQLDHRHYGQISGIIEKQDDIFYCMVIDDFWPDDIKEKEVNTIEDANIFVNRELILMQNYYLNKTP